LFYFVPQNNVKFVNVNKLLSELRRVLKKKKGLLYVIEPHGMFWLAPWLGGVEHPFTVLTEYQQKK
jgi:ubiquinone/menaquinone biosynthesis C-methylase UbiE